MLLREQNLNEDGEEQKGLSPGGHCRGTVGFARRFFFKPAKSEKQINRLFHSQAKLLCSLLGLLFPHREEKPSA